MKIMKSGNEKVRQEAGYDWVFKKGKKELFKKVKCVDSKVPKMGRTKGCGAELEISENDLKRLYWHGTHFRHDYAAFKCAYCGKMNFVKVTDEIWEKTKKKKALFDGFDDSI